MMKRIGWLAAAVMMCCGGVSAQTVSFSGTYAGGDAAALELSVKPLGGAQSREGVKMGASGADFSGDVPVSETGFYMVYGKRNNAQLIFPVYVSPTENRFNLSLRVEDDRLQADAGNDNKALSDYGKVIVDKDRFFWDKGRTLDAESLLRFLKSYQFAADSVVAACRVSEPVRQYLSLWAVTSAVGSYNSVPRATGLKPRELPFSQEDFLPDLHAMLNTSVASCFPTAAYLVMDALPKGGLAERLDYLYGHYTDDAVRGKVADLLADRYVRRFDYSGDYEQGIAELNGAIEKYGLDKRYAEEFARRRSSAKGAPFPVAELVDAEGKPMDFSVFKGYYVYIDLWASWCGPCCREVPFLQELEKDLQNPVVKFLSVSCDKNAAAWKAKMEALNMHGNQWLDEKNALGEALNVQGIPRFLIYDKEGRLYNANAPRPSAPETRVLLESLK